MISARETIVTMVDHMTSCCVAVEVALKIKSEEGKPMNEKELYQQKHKAKLDEWQAEVEKFKAKVSGASADAQLQMKSQIESLQGKIEEGKAKLAELTDASEDAWESIRNGMDSAWESMKSAFSEASARFK